MSEKNTPGVPGQEIDPSSNTTKEPCLIAEVEETIAEVDKAMPRVERAAYTRELMTALNRAVWAAGKLGDLGPEEHGDAAPEPEEAPDSEDDGPVTDPMRPHRSLALLSDGSIALSIAYVEGADLAGRERWEGIILEPEETDEALDRLDDACMEIGAHIGGPIQWGSKKRDEPEGEGSEEG